MIYRVYDYEYTNDTLAGCYLMRYALEVTENTPDRTLFQRLKKVGAIATHDKMKCLRFDRENSVIVVRYKGWAIMELRKETDVTMEKPWGDRTASSF